MVRGHQAQAHVPRPGRDRRAHVRQRDRECQPRESRRNRGLAHGLPPARAHLA